MVCRNRSSFLLKTETFNAFRRPKPCTPFIEICRLNYGGLFFLHSQDLYGCPNLLFCSIDGAHLFWCSRQHAGLWALCLPAVCKQPVILWVQLLHFLWSTHSFTCTLPSSEMWINLFMKYLLRRSVFIFMFSF